jgi:hypothetical protein
MGAPIDSARKLSSGHLQSIERTDVKASTGRKNRLCSDGVICATMTKPDTQHRKLAVREDLNVAQRTSCETKGRRRTEKGPRRSTQDVREYPEPIRDHSNIFQLAVRFCHGRGRRLRSECCFKYLPGQLSTIAVSCSRNYHKNRCHQSTMIYECANNHQLFQRFPEGADLADSP